jgi:ribonuclease P protein component
MLGRLVHSTDFERLRATPPWSRSAHFAVHHLPVCPGALRRPAGKAGAQGLSTDGEDKSAQPVDDSPSDHWLGTVLPKRLARRAVTRNLLRRQIRGAMQRHLKRLPPGLWVVRLRAPFARADFHSPGSEALRRSAGEELDRLLAGRPA